MDYILKGTMIDTETLGLGSQALIWEVACVPFEIHLGEDTAEVFTRNPLHAVVDIRAIARDAFEISQDTVDWTNRQRAGDPIWDFWSNAQLLGGDGRRPGEVRLMDPQDIFLEIDARTGEWEPVWFRNVAFDVPRLDHLFEQTIGRRTPWHRRQQSDIYTMVNVAKQLTEYQDDRPAVAEHGALSDALGQIDQLATLATRLRLGVPASEPDLSPVLA